MYIDKDFLWWKSNIKNSCFTILHAIAERVEKRDRTEEGKRKRLFFMCPFCEDEGRKGMLDINPEKGEGGMWYCYKCKEGGDSVELMKKLLCLEKRDCVIFLIGKYRKEAVFFLQNKIADTKEWRKMQEEVDEWWRRRLTKKQEAVV